MTSRLFWAYGEFCASRPYEVIVAVVTLTGCILSLDIQQPTPTAKPPAKHCAGCPQEGDYVEADVILMTVIRCLAILYGYYQFCNLHKLGSKYILGIAGLFTVFSSFVFTSTVLNLLQIDASELKDALFFFLLLIDLSKAVTLAQFALNASKPEEVRSHIAKGMSLLGPIISLDTLVETLVIGVGTLSGVHRLEKLSYFACLSAIVNYVVFMTFYPACLALIQILQLSRNQAYAKKRSLIATVLQEEDHKSNPVVQRVKLIMSFGLMLVHIHSRWPLKQSEDGTRSGVMEHNMPVNGTDDAVFQKDILRCLPNIADQIVLLILLLALAAKYVFENKEGFKRLHKASMSDHVEEKSDKCDYTKFYTGPMPIANGRPVFLDSNQNKKPSINILKDKQIQTEAVLQQLDNLTLQECKELANTCRSLEECLNIYNDTDLGAPALTDEEVILLVKHKHIREYQLEQAVENAERGVRIRRKILGVEGNFTQALVNLPFKNYDFNKVMGACCENVIGYMPVPVGYAGPLILDSKELFVPMATTEGCLVASTNRGCRALLKTGVSSSIVGDGMTRAPVVRFPSIKKASEAMKWMEVAENYAQIKKHFDSSSRFARLTKIFVRIAGRQLFVRFVAKTGDAMGMNMLSKGTEMSLRFIQGAFPEMEIISISGNFCADKKPAAINWIEGRGKSVVCEAVVPANIITSVLKTSAASLVELNCSKNMIGSAIAGSIGGFNAHAANIVTAIYIATGQDPAQNISSSNCMTLMELWGEHGEDLYISCTMPSVEIGTVGGGTILSAQAACLDMLSVKGAHLECPGENANQLARIVCATVLAGELSLMSALAAGHLVKSHLRHNRSATTIPSDFSKQLLARKDAQ